MDVCTQLGPKQVKTSSSQKCNSIKQKEYVDWVYEKLQPFVRKPPRLYEPTKSVRLRTISRPALTKLMSIFYQNGKKILPSSIEEIIADPLAVAVWFMDDGNAIVRKGKLVGYHINTQSFNLSEHQRLKRMFESTHEISTNIDNNNRYYRLSIFQGKSREKFRNFIQSHIIPSMRYKLGYIGDSLRAP